MSGVEGKKRARLERWLRERNLCRSAEQYEGLVTATLAALSEAKHYELGDLEEIRLSLGLLSRRAKPLIGTIDGLGAHAFQRLQQHFLARHQISPSATKERIQEARETLAWFIAAAEEANQLKKSTSEIDTRGIINDVSFVASAWKLHARKPPSWSRKGHFSQYLREAGFYVVGRKGAKKPLAEETLQKAVGRA